jgi:hypothetical protein
MTPIPPDPASVEQIRALAERCRDQRGAQGVWARRYLELYAFYERRLAKIGDDLEELSVTKADPEPILAVYRDARSGEGLLAPALRAIARRLDEGRLSGAGPGYYWTASE